MRLAFGIRIELNGRVLSDQLCALLEALARDGSLAAAARTVGCSYRHGWDLLRSAESDFGRPLALLERGRGARLSLAGEKLVAACARAREDTAAPLARIAAEAVTVFTTAPKKASARPLRVSASHDLALIEVKRICARLVPPLALELAFKGSFQALDDLARGRCELAGFHTTGRAGDNAPLRPLLSPRHHRLIVLAGRRQGLMVAPANPKAVHSIADLGRRGVRYVNRQAGSATRMLFDRLLAASRLDPSAIAGYGNEEFTHVAVAATIASGHADAGLGIEAAAADFGLDFIPVATETYYLAVRRARLERQGVQFLLRQLTSRAVRRRIARLPGYDVRRCGEVCDVAEAFAASQVPG
ncbi:MAG: helix-turn-helix transcriptional regulator [Burkholderiales bacterium]|nr:helix-turn-helix transcriptional regulator [Burkholderiales bacterium]